MVDPSEGLGATFASKSLGLKHLAISFVVDAEELFQQYQSTWIWAHLQSLALTSQLLQDDGEQLGQIEALLCRAAVLARKMPKIHTFVLWNGGKARDKVTMGLRDVDIRIKQSNDQTIRTTEMGRSGNCYSRRS